MTSAYLAGYFARTHICTRKIVHLKTLSYYLMYSYIQYIYYNYILYAMV